jgi:type IV pilus assembly protein PilW
MMTFRGRMGGLLPGQRGVSIIELLVGLAISLVLAAGIYQVFVGSTTSYSLNRDLSRLQENGRFAMYVLRGEVRGAGYLGCMQDPGTLKNTLNNPGDFVFDFGNAVYGLEAVGDDWQENGGVNVDPTSTGTSNLGLSDPVPGSDILVIRGINPEVNIELTASRPNPSADLQMTSGQAGNLASGGGDILLVTDCEAAAVFQTTNYTNANGNTTHNTGSGTPGNATLDLGHSFGAGAQVFIPRTVAYYVRDNGGRLGLYRKINQATAQEIVEGVENMQVFYGEDTSGDRAADSYVAANAVSDWGNVVSVRIRLLMRTADEILRGPVDTNAYDVDGDGVEEYDPLDDRRMRQVVGGTIGLRNRLR